MSNAEILKIRHHLRIIRSEWGKDATPFYTCNEVEPGQTFSNFAFAFTFSHHMKRHRKAKKRG
jgi:hypothetical protein